jgi:hypothetical protein
MPAPGYPGASPTLANVMSPSAQAVRNGPSFGPNSSPCLGSKPTPNARKLVEVKRHVKKRVSGRLHNDETRCRFNQEHLAVGDSALLEVAATATVPCISQSLTTRLNRRNILFGQLFSEGTAYESTSNCSPQSLAYYIEKTS